MLSFDLLSSHLLSENVVLHGQMEGCKLTVFLIRIIRRIFGPERERESNGTVNRTA